ncbi:Arm DNA-binding domain-containing protein [Bacillus thuringiensis]
MKNKNTRKWYYSVSLGFDAITDKRIRKIRRGFNSQKKPMKQK